jgi:photosystem II stability/assembly factor-like uncharacterized protein
MRRVLAIAVLSLLSVLLPGGASAQSLMRNAERLNKIKLLTPDVGWAATSSHLFWTLDGGGKWTDITPATSPRKQIASVFFLDPSNGWVLLSRSEEPEPEFDLAATTDGGANWSITHLNVPDPEPGRGLSTVGWIDFSDFTHGWIMVRVNSNMAFSIGVLLGTEDGGRTWTLRDDSPPLAGPVQFITAFDGWVAADETDRELYVTHDGGKKWQRVELAAPANAGKATVATSYHLPVFRDDSHGVLLVSYEARNGSVGVGVRFGTADGGKTWVNPRVLPPEAAADGKFSITVADDTLLLLATGRSTRLTISKFDEHGQTTTTGADVGPSASAIFKASFADDTHGWALTTAGALLSTSDGGASWSDATPPLLAPKPGPHVDVAKTRPRARP